MRTCRKCFQDKELNAFKKHSNGYRHVCKKCQYNAEISNPLAHANRIARMKRYRDSEQGKAKSKEYSESASGKSSRKSAVKKYESTEKGYLNKYTTVARRRAARLLRTPKDLDIDSKWIIKEIYKLAADRTKLHGFHWHVDHIIPLQGKTASGLHVPNNLQVIPWLDNVKKHNRVNT